MARTTGRSEIDEDDLKAAVDEARRQGVGLTDLLKRAAYLGAGTVIATQESASRLPREIAQNLVQAVERNKDDFIRVIDGTIRDWLRSIDLVSLARHAADGLDVEVSARVKLRYSGDEADDAPEKGRATSRKTRSRS